MKLIKCIRHAFNMVIHSKLRSWLTIIGIVIGVASVIAIVSIGKGMEQSLNEQMGGLGGDILTLTPGYSQGSNMMHRRSSSGGSQSSATTEEIVLSRTDVQVLKGMSDIKLIDTNIRGSVEVSYLGKSGSVSLTGVDQKVWSQITTSEIRTGRILDSADQNVIIIGGKLADSYFEQPVGINKMLTIEGGAFRVVGILDDTSNSIVMPISMAYQILDDKENGIYDSIIVKVNDEDRVDEIVEQVESKLMTSRHVTEKTRDFTVISSKQIQELRSDMLASMSAFLTAIAAVSLIVGAVGIANTMFTSVLEKTKEIGIMKAIGARNKDILLIFLFNAGFIGLAGGIIGIIFGIMLSSLIPGMLSSMPMGRFGTLVTLDVILMALSVSILVGMIAGIIPAIQGSRLKPVDALRYE